MCVFVYVCQLLRTDRGSHWRQANVETAPFYTNKEVDQLIKEIEVVINMLLHLLTEHFGEVIMFMTLQCSCVS